MRFARLGLGDGDPLPPEHDRIAPAAITLEDLYRDHKPGLLRFVKGYGAAEDAEDIVHQVFVRVAKRGACSAIGSPGRYLRQAARNLVRDRRSALLRTGADRHVSIDDAIVADGDPIAALEARDRLARIEQAVLRLKPLTRQIFLACRIDGCSYGEIAQQTGLSVRGVEKQMNRALKQLERHLSRDG
ncbi:RNA polymerase sigma factor [Novosphingobium kaempferiae]|uniref:RNA polymerase sigma factor n=1 Tax=Novosphingobium kaempferiae TaxID=2896849 RepID=UPI001E33BBC1|nr:sigma-70 family RNA polymerase sigma factor [Novosphingobium kaempferiae]